MTREELNTMMSEYAQWSILVEEAKKELESRKKAIIEYMEANGVDTINSDEHKAMYKPVESTRFDTTAFKKENKDLYDRYTVASVSNRFNFS